MEINVEELNEDQLDLLVARALGLKQSSYGDKAVWVTNEEGRFFCNFNDWAPTSNWNQAGPIIERKGICVAQFGNEQEDGRKPRWRAEIVDGESYFTSLDLSIEGSTPLIAAMRCFVASVFGKEVEI